MLCYVMLWQILEQIMKPIQDRRLCDTVIKRTALDDSEEAGDVRRKTYMCLFTTTQSFIDLEL